MEVKCKGGTGRDTRTLGGSSEAQRVPEGSRSRRPGMAAQHPNTYEVFEIKISSQELGLSLLSWIRGCFET